MFIQGVNLLNDVNKYCDKFIENVDSFLTLKTKDDNKLTSEIIDFIISSGGKRIRPRLVFLCFKACLAHFNVKDEDLEIATSNLVKAASVIELIHTASLLHDDIIDEATKRRGKKTANTIWGNKEVILVGDYLFAKSFSLIAELKNLELVNFLSLACLELTMGEVKQLSALSLINVSIAEYDNIIYQKTASLFECSAKIGSFIAANFASNNLDNNIIKSFANFGMYIGKAFQVVDDILDYDSNFSFFGKDVGRDFLEGKITLPIILGFEDHFILNTFKNKDFTDKSFKDVCKILQSKGILQKARHSAKELIDSAILSLDSIKHSPQKQMLTDLANSLAKRIS
jgi:octaprenyl-diphosphate synthase